jgi:hypothetical protein
VTFAESFERAERDGELSPHAPDALAQIATAALNTFAVRAPHRRRRCGP